MVDITNLKKKIYGSGMTFIYIAQKAGITRETLYNRLLGKGEFTASEIVALTEVLGLTSEEREKIFFAKKVELKATTRR